MKKLIILFLLLFMVVPFCEGNTTGKTIKRMTAHQVKKAASGTNLWAKRNHRARHKNTRKNHTTIAFPFFRSK
jgi:hypothetical protein